MDIGFPSWTQQTVLSTVHFTYLPIYLHLIAIFWVNFAKPVPHIFFLQMFQNKILA